ncbi:hypothetical protein DSM26151_11680 [Agromyces marinus]|nr:hypothetical protein DSM26151_11680 [Agromyces marinus]
MPRLPRLLPGPGLLGPIPQARWRPSSVQRLPPRARERRERMPRARRSPSQEARWFERPASAGSTPERPRVPATALPRRLEGARGEARCRSPQRPRPRHPRNAARTRHRRMRPATMRSATTWPVAVRPRHPSPRRSHHRAPGRARATAPLRAPAAGRFGAGDPMARRAASPPLLPPVPGPPAASRPAPSPAHPAPAHPAPARPAPARPVPPRPGARAHRRGSVAVPCAGCELRSRVSASARRAR